MELFSSALDGKSVTQLTHQHYTFELGPYVQDTVISTDGRQMLFVTLDDRLQLYSLSSTNQKPTDLLFSLPSAPPSRNYVSAYFSPGNNAILFMAASEGKDDYGYDIYRLELASRQVRKLTHNNVYASDFRLSIGGKKAVLLKWKLSRFQKLPHSVQLQLMDIDGHTEWENHSHQHHWATHIIRGVRKNPEPLSHSSMVLSRILNRERRMGPVPLVFHSAPQHSPTL